MFCTLLSFFKVCNIIYPLLYSGKIIATYRTPSITISQPALRLQLYQIKLIKDLVTSPSSILTSLQSNCQTDSVQTYLEGNCTCRLTPFISLVHGSFNGHTSTIPAQHFPVFLTKITAVLRQKTLWSQSIVFRDRILSATSQRIVLKSRIARDHTASRKAAPTNGSCCLLFQGSYSVYAGVH